VLYLSLLQVGPTGQTVLVGEKPGDGDTLAQLLSLIRQQRYLAARFLTTGSMFNRINCNLERIHALAQLLSLIRQQRYLAARFVTTGSMFNRINCNLERIHTLAQLLSLIRQQRYLAARLLTTMFYRARTFKCLWGPGIDSKE
jgi:hypothetical protein